MAYRIVKCKWDTGERYRMLVDCETGLPAAWPTLYITTQVRNSGNSVATMEAALGSLQVLLGFAETSGIDLLERVLKREFLTIKEVDSLCDEAQKAQGRASERSNGNAKVSAHHFYNRLNRIAHYIGWFARTLLDNKGTPEDEKEIETVVEAIRKRRPDIDGNNDWEDRAPSDATYTELMKVVDPTDTDNPFSDPGTSERSMLAVHMLAELGVRRGELLGIRVSDIDWQGRKISIHRRPDDPHDPRMHQPRTKTLARELPLSDELLERLHRYVMGARRRTRGANRHPILLVAHKKGECEGNALSVSGLNKTFETLRNGNKQLVEVHAHGLRHYWNWRFSQRGHEW